MRNFFQRAILFLKLWDFIWSVPLALFLFLAIGEAGYLFFGDGFAGYDPSYLHAAFYTSFIMVFMNAVAWLGMMLNWPGIFKYYSGKVTRHNVTNRYFRLDHSESDFNKLPPIQRICVLLFCYFFYCCLFALLFSLLL
jgi:hypothetical protein